MYLKNFMIVSLLFILLFCSACSDKVEKRKNTVQKTAQKIVRKSEEKKAKKILKSIRSEPIDVIIVNERADSKKISLGLKLFFEPRLSKSGVISCNSCHNLATGGADNVPSSIGHGWQLGPINSPTVLNAKYNLAQFWDGRAKDLKDQAGGPIANPGEMASTHALAVEVLNSIPAYVAEFKSVYGGEKIVIDQIQDAIAAFEETLTTPNSKFDLWLAGDDQALSVVEKEGYALFKSKGCTACHNGPGVGGASFRKLGMVKAYPDSKTLGRFNVTKKESDRFVFKVPLLRNIALTAPYFHDARTWSLKEAIQMMGEYQLGIKVDDTEAEKIVAFLKTLTGDQPQIRIPTLPASTSKTPLPVLKK